VELHRVLAPGGMVFWRSAAKYPWYNAVFERSGFKLEALGMRTGPEKAIDRVNSCVFLKTLSRALRLIGPVYRYASFWKATML
jgi:hypothetical protein